jgi:hypothetical protein
MKKAISPRTHGVLDYATAATAAAAAELFRFSQPAARTARGWAAGYGILSALTDYPLGVRRAVPFRAHGALDFAMAPLIPALPWLLGFARDRRARNFFLGLAAISAIVTAFTDWKTQPSEHAAY